MIADADADRPDALVPRCSTAIAARYIGCTRRHVDALIAGGVLEAWDVRAPGAKRARWSVVVSSLRVLMRERHRRIDMEQKEVAPTKHATALRR